MAAAGLRILFRLCPRNHGATPARHFAHPATASACAPESPFCPLGFGPKPGPRRRRDEEHIRPRFFRRNVGKIAVSSGLAATLRRTLTRSFHRASNHSVPHRVVRPLPCSAVYVGDSARECSRSSIARSFRRRRFAHLTVRKIRHRRRATLRPDLGRPCCQPRTLNSVPR